MSTVSRLAGTAAFAALALGSSRARADEPEAIRFVAHTPPRCALERDIVTQVEALGGQLRAPREEERARVLEVTIARAKKGIDMRLVVHDLVGRVTERQVTTHDCAQAAKIASLLVVLALDETQPEGHPQIGDSLAAEAVGEEKPTLTPAFWPPPVSDDGGTTGMTVERVKVGKLGSGGLLLTGMYGFTDERKELAGARAVAVARVVSTTRLGVGLTLSRDHRSLHGDNLLYETDGWSGRVGGAIGWGAPWDDSVVGFTGELGVAAGEQHGRAYSALVDLRPASETYCYGDCFVRGDAHATSAWFVSPFVSWSMLFQVPLKKSPVRPVAGFTGSWVPFEPHSAVMGYAATLGFVWQAW